MIAVVLTTVSDAGDQTNVGFTMEASGDSIPVFPARFDATHTHALRRSDVPVDRGTTSAEPPDTTGSVMDLKSESASAD